MKAAIIGATGWTGEILVRLLNNHPEVTDIIPVSSSSTEENVNSIDKGISNNLKKLNISNQKYCSVQDAVNMKPDVVFAALPHLKSAEICEPFFNKTVVIDLSADFRIKDRDIFFKAYNQNPPREDILDKAVFGLCEIHREKIKKADIIANPGCYPTCSILPLYPILKNFEAEDTIIINALSGISGAGKSLKENLLFCRRVENCGPYNPGKLHRHTLEIEQELKGVKKDVDVYFNPHLVPINRGMEVTTFLTLKKESCDEEIFSILNSTYKNEKFIKILKDALPESADVWGSNRCDIGYKVFGNKVILFSVIDNLVKGASGQAVQNMNIRFGFKEDLGLSVNGEI